MNCNWKIKVYIHVKWTILLIWQNFVSIFLNKCLLEVYRWSVYWVGLALFLQGHYWCPAQTADFPRVWGALWKHGAGGCQEEIPRVGSMDQQAASASPGNSLEMQIICPSPNPLSEKLAVGLAICWNLFSGNSEVYASLRIKFKHFCCCSG